MKLASERSVLGAAMAATVFLVPVSHLQAQEVEKRLDQRTVIELDEQGRVAILEEMRHHLSVLQSMMDALAKEDMPAVAKFARSSGMQAAREADHHMMEQLPQAFRELGMSMHGDFDAMAAEAEKKPDPKKTLAQLSAALQKCTGCHAAYQIHVKSGPNQ